MASPLDQTYSQQSQLQKSTEDIHVRYDKKDSRIASLERTISYIQEQHSRTISDLHREIERLHAVCTGNSDDIELEMSRPKNAQHQVLERKHREREREREKDPDVQDEEEKPPAMIVKDRPIYLLVEKERRKHQQQVERMAMTIQKKEQEIEQLRTQLSQLKKQILPQETLNYKMNSVMQMDLLKSKIPALPAIPAKEEIPQQGK